LGWRRLGRQGVELFGLDEGVDHLDGRSAADQTELQQLAYKRHLFRRRLDSSVPNAPAVFGQRRQTASMQV